MCALPAVPAGQPARHPAQPAAASRCRRCSTSTATARAARSASRRSATCSTCCGAAITTRIGRRGFINDRVHANIQKDGTFSVVPRMRGGVTSPDELRRIADVADKYNVPMVKVTGSQRIDLLGVKKEDLPKVWADLGMPSGQAYTKGVRMVKTCVGTDFCRFGTQDSTRAGIELERRLRAPLHAAQGEDGHGRLSAQLRRSHGEGHRPGRAGGRLAGRRRRRGRQVGAQGRPAHHRRNDRGRRSRPRSSSSSTTARTPTTSSAPTTSSSASASTRCARKRCTRPTRVQARPARSAAQVEGPSRRRMAGRADARASDAVHSRFNRSRRSTA